MDWRAGCDVYNVDWRARAFHLGLGIGYGWVCGFSCERGYLNVFSLFLIMAFLPFSFALFSLWTIAAKSAGGLGDCC